MADGNQVSQAYVTMRDTLKALSDKTGDAQRQIILLQRAAVAGSLAESAQTKFDGNQVSRGDCAIGSANGTIILANAADGTDDAAIDLVIDAAGKSNTLLNGIVNGSVRLAQFSHAFRGALRVSPPPATAQPGAMAARSLVADEETELPSASSPSYVASVALLFPIEAATLFPLGQEIAGKSELVAYLIIAIIAVFIIALRWIGTQPDPADGKGPPAHSEIVVAVISFLLWVGALKGYWPAEPSSETASVGAKLFGFVIIMWVALVPAFVRKPAQAPASRR